MQVFDLGLRDLKLLKPKRHEDDRGWFGETFSRRSFAEHGLPTEFAQDNVSQSRRGVLRGLHCQVRQPQGKLIRVLSGTIWDVAVDLRRSSPDFGRWFGLELQARNEAGDLEMLWVPEGFAHGFLVLSDCAEVLYKVTRPYDPGGEQTLLWNDPALGIRWPLDQLGGGTRPILSPRDAAGVPLAEAALP